MSKSGKALLDQAVADELALQLSPHMLTLKHLHTLNKTGVAFYWVYQSGDEYWVDKTDLVKECNGLRIKPEYFALMPVVEKRLHERTYLRWYFQEGNVLHPIQISKTEKLHELFWFRVVNDVCYQSMPVLNLENMYLRKKPLMAMRKMQSRWEMPKIADPETSDAT